MGLHLIYGFSMNKLYMLRVTDNATDDAHIKSGFSISVIQIYVSLPIPVSYFYYFGVELILKAASFPYYTGLQDRGYIYNLPGYSKASLMWKIGMYMEWRLLTLIITFNDAGWV